MKGAEEHCWVRPLNIIACAHLQWENALFYWLHCCTVVIDILTHYLPVIMVGNHLSDKVEGQCMRERQ